MGRFRDESRITTLVIHCAATPNGKYFDARNIDDWHKQRGFRRNMNIAPYHAPALRHIGYHYVITPRGLTEVGRPLRETGAHVGWKDRNGVTVNTYSIGTCLIGTDQFTRRQWETLAVHVDSQRRSFRRQYQTDLQVVGHRDLSPDLDGDGRVEKHEWLKICPGFSVGDWLSGGMQPLAGHILEDECTSTRQD